MSRLTRRDLLFAIQVKKDLKSGAARRARLETGVTLAAMAKVLGIVSPQALSQWERDKRTPSDGHAVAYGRLLAELVAEATAKAA